MARKKRQSIAQLLAKYEKQSGILTPKPPAKARMKLRKYTPVKKHTISLKSLAPLFDDTHLVYGPRRRGDQVGKLISKAFSAHNPAYDESAAFLKSKGLGYRRKRRGYYKN